MAIRYATASVARETSFGMLSAAGTPDASGLTFLGTGADTPEVVSFGDMTLEPDERGRSGPWEEPGWVPTTYTGSPGFARRHRRTGEITLRMFWYGYGTRTPGPDAHPLHMILASSLADAGTPTVQTDTWTGVSATRSTATTAGDDYATGDLYGLIYTNGAYAVTGLTHAATGEDLYHSPALPGTLSSNVNVRGMRSLYLSNSLQTGTQAERTAASSDRPGTLALRLDGIDDDRQAVRTYAVGCRLRSAKLTFTNRRAMWELVVYSPFIYDDHSNGAPVDAAAHDGAALFLLGSEVVTTAAIITSAPQELARTALRVNADGVEFSLEWELAELAETSTALGCYDVEPVAPKAMLTVPLSQFQAGLDSDTLNRVRRGLLLTLAPGGGGQGTGGAIYIPAGVHLRDTSIRPQVLEMTQGRSTGDDAGGPAANSTVRIGFGL